MMGYVVHRTYVTIRPRVFLKARRQYLRATRDLEKTGRVPLYRAFKLTSFYGPFKNTNSRKAQEQIEGHLPTGKWRKALFIRGERVKQDVEEMLTALFDDLVVRHSKAPARARPR